MLFEILNERVCNCAGFKGYFNIIKNQVENKR